MSVRSVVYWTATALVALETLAGGATDIAHGETNLVSGTPVMDVVTSLGYPLYSGARLGDSIGLAALADGVSCGHGTRCSGRQEACDSSAWTPSPGDAVL